MRTRPLAATFVLLVFAAAPLALAQKATAPKKDAKPGASASASASSSSAKGATSAKGAASAKGAGATAASAKAAPAASSAAPADTSAAPAAEPEESPSASAAPAGSAAPAALSRDDPSNTAEDPGKRYYFVGLRYRGTVIPQFFENLFVNDGATVYSNTFGAELDMRKDGQSTIPWITYTGYGTGDILFFEKNKPDIAANRSVVHSALSALYLGLDELWSMPIDEAHHWDFEYGFGVGIGIVFGNLYNNWVYQDPTGKLVSSNGTHYSQCQSENQGSGCNRMDHTNATVAKVGNFVEPNWFNGGAVPVLFPHIAFPQLSLRYKPIKQFEARLSLGFSITGFWFGLSADYGLEKSDKEAPQARRSALRTTF